MTVFRLCRLFHNHHTSRVLPCHTVRHFANTTRAMVSVLDAIKNDHRELEEYYSNVINAKDANNQTKWQNQFTWELARHSVGEELVIYPALEKHLGEEGVKLANKDRTEHQVVKEKLKKFQNLTPNEPEFIPTIESLMKDLAQHIEEEETSDFPKLQNALQSFESEDLAKSFDRTKSFVPTRSHPSAPSKPPFETVAGLLAAPIDRLADMFRKFPQ
ncbi:hemerythrin HHE cation binding domain-containing protein [Lipomyces kononenkoae]|uniref:Hemerythrin HHE cation binding domain-containing protein n=1 Tax=Lipomyces kononenkoae TaxID=34357 RepID=A0ACC3SQD6_LIPKO